MLRSSDKFVFINFRWGRWPEILEMGQFKRSWREVDVEDCARIVVSRTLIYIYTSI